MSALIQIVGGCEDTARGCADTEHAKEIAGDQFARDQLGTSPERGAHGFGVGPKHSAEDLVFIPDVLVHGIGELVGPLLPP